VHVADWAIETVMYQLKPHKAKLRAVAKANLFQPRYTRKSGQPVREGETSNYREDWWKQAIVLFGVIEGSA